MKELKLENKTMYARLYQQSDNVFVCFIYTTKNGYGGYDENIYDAKYYANMKTAEKFATKKLQTLS